MDNPMSLSDLKARLEEVIELKNRMIRDLPKKQETEAQLMKELIREKIVQEFVLQGQISNLEKTPPLEFCGDAIALDTATNNVVNLVVETPKLSVARPINHYFIMSKKNKIISADGELVRVRV